MNSTAAENDFNTNLIETSLGWPFNYVNWCQTSQSALQEAETKILSNLKTPFRTRYVNIGPIVGSDDILVWTLSIQPKDANGIPLVLIHGLCSGLALWSLNYDGLASPSDRPIHAIDLPGFGRSSRPPFSKSHEDAEHVEHQLVEIIEAWMNKMNLKKVILLGHSFGGYLAFSYSISYPDRIAHLICTDPWGFSRKPEDLAEVERIPVHVRLCANLMAYLEINPMGPIRLLGYYGGPIAIKLLRGKDLMPHFADFLENPRERLTEYIFHANCQNPTGENAFHSLMSMYGWARNPLSLRFTSLSPNIPLTLIYGSQSWINHYPASKVVEERAPAYVKFHTLNAGHHVYAETASEFNGLVLNVCRLADNHSNTVSGSSSSLFRLVS